MRRLLIALLAAAVGVAALGTAQPYGSGEMTTPIELRLWQGLDDPTDIAVGARAPDGVWGELGMVPLALDGLTASGRYRYGGTTLEVPLRTATPVGVEVWVWQAARDPHVIYVSARGVGGSWDLLGTFRFRVDHGVRPNLVRGAHRHELVVGEGVEGRHVGGRAPAAPAGRHGRADDADADGVCHRSLRSSARGDRAARA